MKCGCLIYFFLNSANLICRGTDISKYFKESLGLRDSDCRLYIIKMYEPLLRKHAFWCAANEDSNQPTYLCNLISQQTLHPWLSKMHTGKVLIRLREYPGWSVTSLKRKQNKEKQEHLRMLLAIILLAYSPSKVLWWMGYANEKVLVQNLLNRHREAE